MDYRHSLLKRGVGEGRAIGPSVEFMYNSVLIACSLVVSEEGGHGEAVIHSERRLFMSFF